MFLESSSNMSFKSSIDKEPSITEERLLTTSYNTVGKSPDAFWRKMRQYDQKTVIYQGAYIAFSWLLPIEETNSIRISHSQRNKFNVSFRQILFFQTVNGSFPIFLDRNVSLSATEWKTLNTWGSISLKTG